MELLSRFNSHRARHAFKKSTFGFVFILVSLLVWIRYSMFELGDREQLDLAEVLLQATLELSYPLLWLTAFYFVLRMMLNARVFSIYSDRLVMRLPNFTVTHALASGSIFYVSWNVAYARAVDGKWVQLPVQSGAEFLKLLRQKQIPHHDIRGKVSLAIFLCGLAIYLTPFKGMFFILGVVMMAFFFHAISRGEAVRREGSVHWRTGPMRSAVLQFAASVVLILWTTPYVAGPIDRYDNEFFRQTLKFGEKEDASTLRSMVKLADERGRRVPLNQVAWALTTASDPALRDYSTAVAFAERSVKIKATRENLDTLACAYMGARQTEKAVEVARQHQLQTRVDQFAQGKLCEKAKTDASGLGRSVASE